MSVHACFHSFKRNFVTHRQKFLKVPWSWVSNMCWQRGHTLLEKCVAVWPSQNVLIQTQMGEPTALPEYRAESTVPNMTVVSTLGNCGPMALVYLNTWKHRKSTLKNQAVECLGATISLKTIVTHVTTVPVDWQKCCYVPLAAVFVTRGTHGSHILYVRVRHINSG